MSPPDARVDDLLDGHFAGELDDAGTARLGVWLLESPVNRRRLLAEAAWRAELRAGLACDDAAALGREPARAARRRSTWPAAAAAAALIAVAATVAGYAARSPDASDASVPSGASVRVTAANGPAWAIHGTDRRALAAGDRLTPGSRLVTGEGGTATVSPDDGTVLAIGAHADLSWLGARDGQRWRLDTGSIDARFSPQPRGEPARIVTAHATMEVVGTMFALAVDGTSTRLAMREGVVEMVARDRGTRLSCHVGQSAIADAAGVRLESAAKGPFNGFSLVDADADRVLPGYDPMADGDIVHLGALPARSITIVVRVADGIPPPASARLLIDGRLHRIERLPYALMGNRFRDAARSVPDFRPWHPPMGRPVRIEAVPCSDPEGAVPCGPSASATFRFEP